MVSYFKGKEKMRVFENKIIRKIFVSKRDKQTGEWRKLHNVKLRNLYRNVDIIRTLKSHRLRWTRRVARMGNVRRAHNYSPSRETRE